MTTFAPALLAAMLLAGLAACSSEPAAPGQEGSGIAASPAAGSPSAATLSPGTPTPPGKWQTTSSGEGDGLFFGASEGEAGLVHVFCPADGGLLVNVNRFTPVGSEERMSFGSGGTVVALVADPAGDSLRGGVSGEGPVPAELAAIVGGAEGIGVNYGAQNLGPLPPVPPQTAEAFVAGCFD